MKNEIFFINKATLADMPKILDLCLIMHKESIYCNIPVNISKLNSFLKSHILSQNSLFILLKKNNEIIGFFVGNIVTYFFSDSKIAMDIILFIKPNYRNHHGAQKLLSDFIDWCHDKDVREISLSSTTGIEKSKVKQIYSKFGFNKIGFMYKIQL